MLLLLLLLLFSFFKEKSNHFTCSAGHRVGPGLSRFAGVLGVPAMCWPCADTRLPVNRWSRPLSRFRQTHTPGFPCTSLLVRQPARLSFDPLLLLLLLLLSPFALFQFSITTIQSQTCECNPRTQNLWEKTSWNTSEVAERAWRGRRMDSVRAAYVALNMKATFNTQLWTPYA